LFAQVVSDMLAQCSDSSLLFANGLFQLFVEATECWLTAFLVPISFLRRPGAPSLDSAHRMHEANHCCGF
jgi:hypothetical protein